MYRREHRHQLSFADFFLPFGGKLSGDNRWINWLSSFPGMNWRITKLRNSVRGSARQPSHFAWRSVL
jgi:hypothetical protein